MEFTLKSGAKLNVTEAPFEDAADLSDAVLNCIKDLKLTDDVFKIEIDAANPMNMIKGDASLVGEILNKILTVATSKEVKQCLFKCFERVAYDGIKVTKDLFDDPKIGPQARKDYYLICMKTIEVNCLPFFVEAFSGLKHLIKTPPNTQKPPSKSKTKTS